MSATKNYNIALKHKNDKNYSLAIEYLQKALLLDNKNINYLNEIGTIYNLSNLYKNAIECYYKILYIQPNNYEMLYKIGECYYNMNNIEMAIRCFIKLSNKIPKNFDLFLNIATCYNNIKDYKSSIQYYLKAIDIKNDNNIFYFLGDLYFYIKDYDNSIKYYNKINNKTLLNIIDYNKCFPYLAKKDFKIGFELYENRLKKNYCNQMKTIERVDIPHLEYWDGKTIMESPLLVVYEQGLGDNILYYRFMIELSELYPNMNIHYFCKDTISHIFKEFPNIKIIDNVILQLYKYKLYIMSLPRILNINKDIISFEPNKYDYIKVNKKKLLYWKDKLSIFKKLKVGFVYNGLLSSFIDKYIPLESFNELTDLDIDLICLQKISEIKESDRIINKNINYFDIDNDKPFEDTIAILKNIDLLITIDTVTVHLAGALNIKTWLLLGNGSDWRWFNDNKCVWYNSVEIIRMTENKQLKCIIKDIVKNKLI
jgi:ADP-heptose:LPS heptosyltransferase